MRAKVVGEPEVNGVHISEMKDGDLAVILNEGGSSRWPIGTILYRPPSDMDRNNIICFDTNTHCGIKAYPDLRVRILQKDEKVELTV